MKNSKPLEKNIDTHRMSLQNLSRPATTLGRNQIDNLQNSHKHRSLASGFESLKKYCKDEYVPRPLCIVDIGPHGVGRGHKEFSGDSMQTFAQTLMFLATKNKKYAEKAMLIMDAWFCGCCEFKGSNSPLEVAWGATCMVRSCEVLKFHYNGFDERFQRRMNKMIDTIFLPNLKKRYEEIRRWNNNWILTMTEALIQIALFRGDFQEFVRLNEEFKKHFIACVPHSNGRSTETTRDLIHAQFQIGSIIQICEMAWHQKINLYSFLDERARKTMEYHAEILLGRVPNDVKKEQLKDVWFMPCVWEMGLNHYKNRMKKSMPFTEELLNKKRPETASFNWGPSWMFFESQ